MDIRELKDHLTELDRQENVSWVSRCELDFPGHLSPPSGISYAIHYKNTFQNMIRDLQALSSVLEFVSAHIQPAPIEIAQLKGRFNALNRHTPINIFSGLWMDYRKTINRTKINQQPLLFLALMDSSSSPVEPLIHLTDDLKFVNDQNETALFIAAKHDNNLLCYTLLNAGASPTPNSLICQSPFSMAIRKRNISLIEAMIEKKADIYSKDFEGNTPLHYVKDVYVMKLLLDKGADPRATNKSGLTPLDRINQRIADGHDNDQYAPHYLVSTVYRQRRRLTHCFKLEEVEPHDPFLDEQQAVKQVLVNVLNASAPVRPTLYSRILASISRAEPATDQSEPTRERYIKLL